MNYWVYRAPSSVRDLFLDYIERELSNLPFDKIDIENFPLNSEEGNYPAWEPIKLEANIVKPIKEKIISYDDIPTCITWYSNSTPQGGITAEICVIKLCFFLKRLSQVLHLNFLVESFSSFIIL